MTDDERRNRNPAVEIERHRREDFERANPIVTAAELELRRVYVLQSQRFITTLNYMGVRHLLNPLTLDAIRTHHFHGPRVNLDIYLAVKPGGKFEDASGNEITVRRWTGADQ